MYPFLLIVVLLTTAGELQTNSQPVTECPSEEAMQAQIADLKKAGVIKDWGAFCIATKFPMNSDGSPVKGTDI